MIVHAPQVVAVRHRRERAIERKDLEPVMGKIELADDLWPQQRHYVRAHREAESLEHLLGHGGATDQMTSLEHEHLAAAARKIRGGRQNVVAADYDDHVVHS